MTKIHSLRIKIKGPGFINMIEGCQSVVGHFWSIKTWYDSKFFNFRKRDKTNVRYIPKQNLVQTQFINNDFSGTI